MDFGTIIWLLIIAGIYLYRRAKKEAEKQAPRPMDRHERKDGEFSLDEVLRKLEEAQKGKYREQTRPKPVSPEPDNRLPFEKRKPLEKTFSTPGEKRIPLEKTIERPGMSRERQPKIVDYDEQVIERHAHHGSTTEKKLPSTVSFHFNEPENQGNDVKSWLNMREAIIAAEILKRPEY